MGLAAYDSALRESEGQQISHPWCDYEPGNCKWATRSEQGRNKRNNRLVMYEGETLCVAEWAERKRLKYLTLYMRLFASGWDVERALNTPVR